jgi:hypothetical protein
MITESRPAIRTYGRAFINFLLSDYLATSQSIRGNRDIWPTGFHEQSITAVQMAWHPGYGMARDQIDRTRNAKFKNGAKLEENVLCTIRNQ